MYKQNKIQKTIWIAATVLLFSMTTSLYAEKGSSDCKHEKHQKVSVTPGRAGYLQSVDKLLKTRVTNSEGQAIGKVNELILDEKKNIVYYVVLSSEDKLYPVPWSKIKFSENKSLLKISQADLKEAPSIDSLDSLTLKQIGGADYGKKVCNFYSAHLTQVEKKCTDEKAVDLVKETSGTAAEPVLCRSSEVIGLNVQNLDGQSLGKLGDLVVDVRGGNLAYGLVNYGGVLNIAQKTAAVPWACIKIQQDRTIAKIDADQRALDAAVIDKDGIKNLTKPEFARMVYDRFNTQPYWEIFGFSPAGETELFVEAWHPDSAFNKNFDLNSITTVEGTIESIGTFYPEIGAVPGTRLDVKTQKGELVTVYTGPQSFVKQSDIGLKVASRITAIGSKTIVAGNPVIVACEIQVEGKTLKLRDNLGIPLWNIEQLRQAK